MVSGRVKTTRHRHKLSGREEAMKHRHMVSGRVEALKQWQKKLSFRKSKKLMRKRERQGLRRSFKRISYKILKIIV